MVLQRGSIYIYCTLTLNDSEHLCTPFKKLLLRELIKNLQKKVWEKECAFKCAMRMFCNLWNAEKGKRFQYSLFSQSVKVRHLKHIKLFKNSI